MNNKFLWLVRRELWESRSAWLAPLAVGGVWVASVLLGVINGSIAINGLSPAHLARLHERLTPDNLDGIASLALTFIGATFLVLVAATQFFYAIDSLYGERRDRSVLFWKSMPVSDRETVLSKFVFATLVMPVVAALVALATQVVVFAILSPRVAAIDGVLPHLWSPAVWGGSLLLTAYGILVFALWYLPLVGWYLLVSAWVPRSPLMFATLPPLALMLAERIVFGTHYTTAVVMGRLMTLGPAFGGRHDGTDVGLVIDNEHLQIPRTLVDAMRPLHFLGSPEVWAGVVLGVALVVAAIYVRRTRDEAA
ncbi:MAG: ABC-2 transporter permease [Proteobacteria bacterium]|nr:ABC-2 transporter permease [Pseudomonadota bacterium]